MAFKIIIISIVYVQLMPNAPFSLHCTVEDRVRFVQSFAQTCETAEMYRSRILIAPPTSAYTQPPVRAATLVNIRARMRSNAKHERRAKKVPAKGGHVPPVPGRLAPAPP